MSSMNKERKIIKITSAQNSHFKNWKSLLTSKGLKNPEFPFCIVSGSKIVDEILQAKYTNFTQEKTDHGSKKLIIDSIIYSETQLNSSVSHIDALTSSIQKYVLPQTLFKELDVLGTHSPLLIVRQPQIKKWNPQSQPQGLELILPLGDPNNLGAAIRSATAFGASKIILTTEAAHPFLPKSIKASSGSVFLCELFQAPPLHTQDSPIDSERAPLHSQNSVANEIEGPLITLDLQGPSIYDFQWPKDLRLLVGEEGPGVPHLACKSKKTITIPMQNGVESLNANVSLSLALYEYQRHFKI